MTDDDGLSWLPLLEAAMRLGKSTDAVRSMIRRDKLATRKGNDGRLLIGVPAVAGQAADGLPTIIDQATDGRMTADLRLTIEELRDELMETREQLAGNKATLEAAATVAEARISAAKAEIAARPRARRPAHGRAGGAAPAVVAEVVGLGRPRTGAVNKVRIGDFINRLPSPGRIDGPPAALTLAAQHRPPEVDRPRA